MIKNSFVLFAPEYAQLTRNFTKEQKADFFDAILDYVSFGFIPSFDDKLQQAFGICKARIDENSQKYQEKCDKLRANARQKQGDKRANEHQKQSRSSTNAKQKQGDTDTDTDTDTVNFSNEKLNNLRGGPREREKSNEKGAQAVGDYLSSKGIPIGGKKGGAVYPWQDKAKRYADAMGIKLEGNFTYKNQRKGKLEVRDVAKSWFALFSPKNSKKFPSGAGNLDAAFAFLVDSPTYQNYDRDRRMAVILYIFHHGLDAYKQLGKGTT